MMTGVVAFDGRQLAGQPTGVGRYIGMLVAAADSAGLHTRVFVRGDLEPVIDLPRCEIVKVAVAGPRWHTAVRADLERRSVDAYFSTSLIVPLITRARTLPLVLDLTTFTFPGTHTWRTRAFERILAPRVAQRRPLVTMSQTSAQDIETYLRPRYPVSVVPPWVVPDGAGSRPDEALRRLKIERPYVLAVGTIEPRKNVLVLVDAVERLRRNGTNVRLVLAGAMGWADSVTRTRIRRGVYEGAICETGYVPDEDRDALYAGADVYALPSLAEGFGLPLLEAMARGVPVVASTAPALMEAAGGAAVHVPPTEVATWAATLARILNSAQLRSELAARSRKRAADYSLRATAASLQTAIAEASPLA